MRHLVLGGVKSGKSGYAEALAHATNKPVTYIATATIEDHEMDIRIAQHQQRRPPNWRLIEEPIALAFALQQVDRPDSCILVDCLTLWMTNLLLKAEHDLPQQLTALRNTIEDLQADLILVSNETNMGITPMDSLTRRYCDEMGLLHQALAAQCERVTLVVAGLATPLKG